MRCVIRVVCLLTVVVGVRLDLQAADESIAQPKLPKIVLIGDSIRLSYAPTVITELEGTATVVSPKPNGGDSSNVLKHLQEWVIKEQPDVVHFNCGIHDTKKFKETGKFQVSPERYAENLRQIVARVRKETNAVVLFATSTPVLDDRAAKVRADRDYELLNASIEQYNAIARKVMRELDVPVNDLNQVLAQPEPPLKTAELIVADGVHLTERGRQMLGRQVATFVRKHLATNTE